MFYFPSQFAKLELTKQVNKEEEQNKCQNWAKIKNSSNDIWIGAIQVALNYAPYLDIWDSENKKKERINDGKMRERESLNLIEISKIMRKVAKEISRFKLRHEFIIEFELNSKCFEKLSKLLFHKLRTN